ncbi:hypothetical protein DL240_10330 [Lujinxingia litoralis]|uniref:Uncharacterized protein n=2 Tax=Lujinxingia litoralis TaxID=2211119 RepID=A0A328C4J0_9DELT|nr:hypothetical protein DL240_10330 [Lujinxingia litoralis]
MLVAVLMSLSGCAGSREAEKPQDAMVDDGSARAHKGNLSRRGLTPEVADLNGDDAPDQWVLRDDEGLVVRVERDLSFNGQVDLWQHYDASGEVVEEEMDLDLDGRIDMITFFENGKVVRRLLSIGFDNSFPIEKFYDSEEKLLRVERDEDNDGRPNIWEYYEEGQRVRIGWDTTGDGQPDSFDQL